MPKKYVKQFIVMKVKDGEHLEATNISVLDLQYEFTKQQLAWLKENRKLLRTELNRAFNAEFETNLTKLVTNQGVSQFNKVR